MHQLKAINIPKGKMKDKGVLIHNLCKVGKENILFYTSFEALFESELLFTTKNGYIKRVSGVEFETNRSTIASTKLEDGDEVVSIIPLTSQMILQGDQKVILLTSTGGSLGFGLEEVSEMKKGGRGVKGIALEGSEVVTFTTVVPSTTETFEYEGKELSAKKVRNRKRGSKSQKAQI